jgi:glutaredoxin-like YruB-family protein
VNSTELAALILGSFHCPACRPGYSVMNEEGKMSAKEVKVYSTPTCPYCKMAKKFLEDHGIVYQHFNVAEDKAAREEMISKSGQMGVPVINIDGEIIVGFDQAQLKKKLGL